MRAYSALAVVISDLDFIEPGPDYDIPVPDQHPESVRAGPGQQQPEAGSRVRTIARVQQLSMEDVMKEVTASDAASADRYLRNIEVKWGMTSGFKVHSMRPGGVTGRRTVLKRRAEHISRSASETFSYLTTTNASEATARKFLSTFGNVSSPSNLNHISMK